MLNMISTSYGMLTRPTTTRSASNGARPELTVQGLPYILEGARLNGTPAETH